MHHRRCGQGRAADPVEVDRLDSLQADMHGTVHRRAGARQHADHGEGLVGMFGRQQVGTAVRQRDSLAQRIAQRLRHLELPLALPTIVAGVRTATAIAIGTATIAAFVGAGGFGERIVTGLALNDRDLLLAGALPAALLALVSEGLFEWLEKYLARHRRV